MNSKFDVVIFGASGCIGQCVVTEAVQVLHGLTWAIAGYSRYKLETILEKICQNLVIDKRSIPIIVAEASDEGSVEEMVQNCKVLVNCCGPYQLWAELIIRKCIECGTHYVDMCNDPYFNELMELRYHLMAKENNVYVISSCGYPIFPIEMGINYMKQNFRGTINHVDSYVHYTFGRNACYPVCPLFSQSVWINLIWSLALIGELAWLRDELREVPLPILNPQQKRKDLFHKPSTYENVVYLRFPFADQQAIERSQYRFYVHENSRPLQFYQYLQFSSFLLALFFLLWYLFISLLSQYYVTRNFIITHPKLFSLGLCSRYGCEKYVKLYCSYKITLQAEGWSCGENRPSKCLLLSDSLDRHMTLEISGSSPNYDCASVCLLLSALCLLEEQDNMPESGGVYSPGYAFYKTTILERLRLFPRLITFRFL